MDASPSTDQPWGLPDFNHYPVDHRVVGAFDNRRILHGRGGLDRSTGERWLRGCYVEREELASRLRILQRTRGVGG